MQSGKPLTPAGPVVLDPEPDIREVLLLADELQLDEVLAVLCVQGALQEVRCSTAGLFVWGKGEAQVSMHMWEALGLVFRWCPQFGSCRLADCTCAQAPRCCPLRSPLQSTL